MNLNRIFGFSQFLAYYLSAAIVAGWAGTAQGTITWNLTGSGNWDASSTNWTADGGVTTTNFTDDGTVDVIFNKTTGGTISISANMSPLSTTVSASSGTYIFSGGPIDSGTLSKSGAGILTLSGANSFSSVTLSAGQLNINNAGALGTGTVTVNGGVADNMKIDNTSGSAKTLSSVSQYNLSGDITFVASGSLNLGSGAVTLNSSVVAIRGNSLGANFLTIGGNIASTTNGFVVIKGAFVVLSGTNSYSGATAFANFGSQLSQLRADDGVGLPAASCLDIQTAGVFETSKDLVRVGGAGAGQMRLGSNIKNSVGFSAYGGPVKVCFGTLVSPTALTWGSGDFNPGTFGLILNYTTANNTLDFKNPVNLNTTVQTVTVRATDPNAIATMSGVLSGTGSSGLTKAGAGTLVLSGANTYPGTTTVSAGTLKAGIPSVAGVSGAFGLNSAVTNYNVAGVTLDISGFDTAIGSLAGGGATGGNVALGTNTLTIGANNNSTTFAGVISGSNTCGLVKTGTGILTLSGANTYTGDTTVNGGVLAFGNTNAIGNTKALSIAVTNASVSLPSGTTTVNALYIGGKQQVKGTWGSSTSGAANQNNTYFSGTGMLDVKTGSLAYTLIMVR